MGVKSTQRLTRQDAERRYVEAFVEMKALERRLKLERRLEDAEHAQVPYQYDKPENDAMRDLSQNSLHAIYVAVDLATRIERYRNQARHAIIGMTDTELENDLERVHDASKEGGEGFENYIIVSEYALRDEL